MKYSPIKQAVAKIVSKHYKRAKKTYGFVVGGVDLVASDRDGNLYDRAGVNIKFAGNEEQSLSKFSKKDVQDMVNDAMKAIHASPNVDVMSLEVGFSGRYDGYESVHAFRNDEFGDSFIEDFYIPIWTYKDGYGVTADPSDFKD